MMLTIGSPRLPMKDKDFRRKKPVSVEPLPPEPTEFVTDQEAAFNRTMNEIHGGKDNVKILIFTGYFFDTARDQRIGVKGDDASYKIRRELTLKYFTETGEWEIWEPKVQNSGVYQGRFLRKTKLEKKPGVPLEPVHLATPDEWAPHDRPHATIQGRYVTITGYSGPTARYLSQALGPNHPHSRVLDVVAGVYTEDCTDIVFPHPTVITQDFAAHERAASITDLGYIPHSGFAKPPPATLRSWRSMAKSPAMGHRTNTLRRVPGGGTVDVAKNGRFQVSESAIVGGIDQGVAGTLRFECIYDDRHRLNGELVPYVLLYFLEDGTVQINEKRLSNSGRGGFPMLLARQHLPKDDVDLPPGFGSSGRIKVSSSSMLETGDLSQRYGDKGAILASLSPSHSSSPSSSRPPNGGGGGMGREGNSTTLKGIGDSGFGGGKVLITEEDLVVGTLLSVYGKRLYVADCDAFTRAYYRNTLAFDQPPPNAHGLALMGAAGSSTTSGDGGGSNGGGVGSGGSSEINGVLGGEDEMEGALPIGKDSPATMKDLSRKQRTQMTQLLTGEGRVLQFPAIIVGLVNAKHNTSSCSSGGSGSAGGKTVVPDGNGGEYVLPSEAYKVRRFLVSYYLRDHTISVAEVSGGNSGFVNGRMFRKSEFTAPSGVPYRLWHFFDGAVLTINAFRFKLQSPNPATASYLEEWKVKVLDAVRPLQVAIARSPDPPLCVAHILWCFRPRGPMAKSGYFSIKYNAAVQMLESMPLGQGNELSTREMVVAVKALDINNEGIIDYVTMSGVLAGRVTEAETLIIREAFKVMAGNEGSVLLEELHMRFRPSRYLPAMRGEVSDGDAWNHTLNRWLLVVERQSNIKWQDFDLFWSGVAGCCRRMATEGGDGGGNGGGGMGRSAGAKQNQLAGLLKEVISGF